MNIIHTNFSRLLSSLATSRRSGVAEVAMELEEEKQKVEDQKRELERQSELLAQQAALIIQLRQGQTGNSPDVREGSNCVSK